MLDQETIDTINQLKSYLDNKDLHPLRDLLVKLESADIADLLTKLEEDDQLVLFRILPKDVISKVFSELDTLLQEKLLRLMGTSRAAKLLNEMEADDRTALLEELPTNVVKQMLSLLTKEERMIASTLLGYPESSVGRLMNPDYVAIQPEWNITNVLEHIRNRGKDFENFLVLYVIDAAGKLIDEVNLADILLAQPNVRVSELLDGKYTAIEASADQETAVEKFKRTDRTALPVIDSYNVMLGIITVDDVFHVAEEEATEDIQKLGGSQALEDPYLQTSIISLIKKRAGWLTLLFVGEMFTASAMKQFESEIAKAVILAIFVPLIISSGGNSGSQATSLVIRALALGEIQIKDWLLVFKRELVSGIILGTILGIVGCGRVYLWGYFDPTVARIAAPLAATIFFSLLTVVIWGTITGSMLPLILKKIGLDPATASAPFVATLVDVTGIVAYFFIAATMLKGVLL